MGFNQTQEGQSSYAWWATWIPTPAGQQWAANKRFEAKRVLEGMINQWGLVTLQGGEGVIDIGGDPGFLAVECVKSGIPITVVDPAFGVSGKADAETAEFLQQCDPRLFRCIRQPFTQAFADDPVHAKFLRGVVALVALYPDEATAFCLQYTASQNLRTAIIPCNECKQYYPPNNPTYEGFV